MGVDLGQSNTGDPQMPIAQRFFITLLLLLVASIGIAEDQNLVEPQPIQQVATTVVESKVSPFTIGILAKNTEQEVYNQWQPLVDFLNRRLPNFHFQINPLGFDETLPAIETAKIDFLITNPAFYSIANRKYGTYALATRSIHTLQSDVAEFGGVIISQLGVDVIDTAKLHQEDIAAVAPYSLGGYLTQKKFFKEHFNIALNDRRVKFYHSHYDVLNATLSGEAKVGLIRTGALEKKGVESMLEVYTLPGFPSWHFARTTQLYPEWPFAALAHIPLMTAEKILPILLEWESKKNQQKNGFLREGESWTVARSYHSIFELLNEFRIEPYVQQPSLSWNDWLAQYQQWGLFFLALMLGLILMASLLSRKAFLGFSKTPSLQRELSEKEELINVLQLENENLIYQQKRFQILSDTSSEGVVIFSFSGHIQYINPYALRFWGKEHATIDRLNAYHLLSDLEDRRRLHEMMEGLDESTQSPTFLEELNAKLISANGRVKAALLRVSAIKHDHKWLLIVNFNDLSEQKNLEKSYRQSLFVAQNYIEQSHQAIFTFNQNFELLNLNDNACELFSFGYDQAFCGKSPGQKLPLEDVSGAHVQWLNLGFSHDEQAELILQLNEIKREDRDSQFNFLLSSDYQGIFKGYQLHFSFVRSYAMGESYFMCVAQDISEVKAVEHSDSSNNLDFESLINNNHTGLLVLDQQGKALYCNQSVAKLMGVQASSILGSQFGLPVDIEHNHTDEFEIFTADGAQGIAQLAYTETQWQGQPAYLVFMYDVTELKASKNERSYHAMHDPLTGLPNRRFLMQYLDQLVATSQVEDAPFGLALIQIKNLQILNETIGSKVSDEVVLQVVHHLKQVVRSTDKLVRLSEDSFCLVLLGVERAEMFNVLAQKLFAMFAGKISLAEGDVELVMSVGGVIHPAFGHSSIGLLKMAEQAKQQASQQAKSAFVLFDENLSSSTLNNYSLENELMQAVQDQAFVLYFQPQMNVEAQTWVGAEALLRWHHSERGMLFPELFLSLLETNGKIIEIGDWVLEQSVQWAKQAELVKNAKRLSINVSGHQLMQADFSEKLRLLLQKYSLDAQALAIEFNETAFLQDPHNITLNLQQLSEMGVEIHLDNLGLEFHSLSQVKGLPIDWVKLDHELVWMLDNQADESLMIQALIKTIQSMGIKVVAQGVETVGQQQRLLELGCNIQQGNLFAQPMEANAFVSHYVEYDSK